MTFVAVCLPTLPPERFLLSVLCHTANSLWALIQQIYKPSWNTCICADTCMFIRDNVTLCIFVQCSYCTVYDITLDYFRYLKMNTGQSSVKQTSWWILECLSEDLSEPRKSSEVMAGERRWRCQVSFQSLRWFQVLTWGDINRQQVCSLPLIITVTPPLLFPGPLQSVFSTKCISGEHYISTPPVICTCLMSKGLNDISF